MRKLLLMALPCLLLLGAAGCKGKSDEPENMKGSVPRPTNWVAPTDYDYSSSMTAIIRLPDALQATQKAEDLLAAFDAAGHCLGVASLSTKSGGEKGLFFLYITAPANEADNSISLQYWSAYWTNIFTHTDAFVFTTDAMKGTMDQPFVLRIEN